MKIYTYEVDKYFVLSKILYGQCFRWNLDKEGKYIGVVGNNVIKIWQEGNIVKYYGLNNKNLDKWFNEYFDISRDYKSIIERIQRKEKNELLDEIIRYSKGTRILNQDKFEMVVSYIFSASNNITRIMSCIEKLCMLYGNKLFFEGKEYYSFPTIEQLEKVKESDYREKIKIGFRAPYVANTIKKLLKQEKYALKDIEKKRTEEIYKLLLELDGVGPKVANCILLFSMNKKDVFPIDVWIEKVMRVYLKDEMINKKGIGKYVKNAFGENAGIINHYMFYWGRENKIE